MDKESDNDSFYIQQVINGDTTAFTHIVNKYKDMVFSICIKVTKDHDIAEEVAQDTFVKAYNNIESFRKESKLSTWLYRIAYNTSISTIRKKKIEFTPIQETIVENYSIEEINTDIEGCDRKVVTKKMMDLVSDLSDKDRALIHLFYLEQNSVDDISEITQMSKSNIKVRLHRLRKKLFNDLSCFLKKQSVLTPLF
ncbi:MAG: RNA polymerase sigma factor [Hyphomicrobiales bacterium]